MLHGNRRRIDRNSFHRVQQSMEKPVECDPSLPDADVGILSCGYNEYCVKSDDSNLGGRCVPAISRDHLRRLEEEETNEDDDTAACSGSMDVSFETVSSYCDYPNCTCTNVNEEEQTLNTICNMEEYCYESVSHCGVNITDCFFMTGEITVNDASTYHSSFCYDRTGKGDIYGSSICINHTSVNFSKVECAVSFNGESCASCDIVPTFYEIFPSSPGTYCYNITYDCFHYDCTNVKSGWKGNDCFPVPFQNYGCVECSLCNPGEVVTFPDATMVSVSRSDVNVEAATRCGDGHLGWQNVTLAECAELQVKARDMCGCVSQSDVGGTETNVPTQTPGDTEPSGTISFISFHSIVMMTTLLSAVHEWVIG
ncbi:hypothetical protein IV203_015787 [Nitzschia inconspicua]|uniref:Uncharacterized protein n=1 Tax=Nitzschia inconspicua TaxID=303405 RepID=A0A9K3LBY1_9STRA|nr:hypothetical protein IV203_015787 [Nitzschia inconspicua]